MPSTLLEAREDTYDVCVLVFKELVSPLVRDISCRCVAYEALSYWCVAYEALRY